MRERGGGQRGRVRGRDTMREEGRRGGEGEIGGGKEREEGGREREWKRIEEGGYREGVDVRV